MILAYHLKKKKRLLVQPRGIRIPRNFKKKGYMSAMLYSDNSEDYSGFCKYFCKRRTCKYLRCRKEWAKKEWKLLMYAHHLSPFTHKLRLSCPGYKTEWAKMRWLKDKWKIIKTWKNNHKNETCDIILYPDQHDTSSLHFNAICRLTPNAAEYIQDLLNSSRKIGRDSYCFKELDFAKRQLKYACGHEYMEQIGIIQVRMHRFPMVMGKPLIFSRNELNRYYKNAIKQGRFREIFG